MPSEPQEPWYGQEQAFDQSEQPASVNRAWTSQQRKIDPMGMMGKIFTSVGAVLVILGLLLAYLLERGTSGGFGSSFVTLAGAWGTGLVFLLLGLVQLLFFRNVESAKVVESYFLALANQDYTTAFGYLDQVPQTPTGAQDTQTWFTGRAQASDEQGPMTDYALRGFQLNSRGATYTIKVRRGERVYPVHLSLVKRGDTWKISGFELF